MIVVFLLEKMLKIQVSNIYTVHLIRYFLKNSTSLLYNDYLNKIININECRSKIILSSIENYFNTRDYNEAIIKSLRCFLNEKLIDNSATTTTNIIVMTTLDLIARHHNSAYLDRIIIKKWFWKLLKNVIFIIPCLSQIKNALQHIHITLDHLNIIHSFNLRQMSIMHKINTHIIINKYYKKYCYVVILPKPFNLFSNKDEYNQVIEELLNQKQTKVSNIFNQIKNFFTYHL